MVNGSGSSVRVLLVEGATETNPAFAAELERTCDALEVRTAATDCEALDAVSDDDVDCVVCWHDATLDGVALLERVREEAPALPFVLVPVDGDESLASDAIAAGVSEYVPASTEFDAETPLAERVAAAVVRATNDRGRRLPESEGRASSQQEVLFDLATDDAVTSGEFDEAVERITETAADVLAVDRVGVWLFDDDRTTLTCVDLYDRTERTHERGRELDAGSYPSYFDALRNNRTVGCRDARADPRTAELGEYLEANDIGALLDATLRSEGEVVGVLCHEHAGGERDWRADEVQFAGDVADVVHRALRNEESVAHRAQLEFRRSLLKAQQEAIPGGVLVVDDAGAVVSYNERLLELWDLPEETVASGNATVLRERMSRQMTDPAAYRREVDALVDDATTTYRDELSLADGRIFDRYTTPVVDDDGHAYGRLWLFRDVTDREQRQAELELKNRVIDEAPIGISITDPRRAGNPLVYANEGLAELTGYSTQEMLGRNLRFLQADGTAASPVAEMRAAIDAERPVTVELRNARKDGSTFWNRVTIAPIHDAGGEVSHFVGFQEDVTDRKQRDQQLDAMDRVLRHNLRNQLNVIAGSADAIAEATTGDVASHAAAITESSRDLLGLTEKQRQIVSLLSSSPNPVAVDVSELVRECVATLQERYPTAQIDVSGPDELQSTVIPQLHQAVRELVENAIVHSDALQPAVSVDLAATSEGVRIRVTDTGPGIPEAEQAILRGEGERDALFHGSGMGLWLVDWIVAYSGGSVSYAENTPRGSIVEVVLRDHWE